MKVAIYTSNLTGLAGIERVVREHLRIFHDHDVATLTFGEVGCDVNVPIKGEARQACVRRALESFAPDVCLLHGVSHVGFNDDITVLKALCIPSVAVCHFSFPSALLLDGDEDANRVFFKGAHQCDVIATVSAIDTMWWRAMGCRAFHVQNPFVHPKMNAERNLGGQKPPRSALWVGRQAQQKQPRAALAAFAEVIRAVPDAHLTMVGGSQKGWGLYCKLAEQLGIAQHVTFLPARDDIAALWNSADFHLLSSITESFCLVLAEAKAWGKPTIMFDIPFLELTETKRGLLVAPQGDVDGLAKQMIRIMTEPGLCERLGAEATESLSAFNDDAVWASWDQLFAALKTGEGGYEVAPELKTVVSQITVAWDNFCERNLWAVDFSRNWQLLFKTSWKPMAKAMLVGVVGVRKIKASLRKLR